MADMASMKDMATGYLRNDDSMPCIGSLFVSSKSVELIYGVIDYISSVINHSIMAGM